MNTFYCLTPIYAITLGTLLALAGLFTGNVDKVKELSIALISGGTGAYMRDVNKQNNGVTYHDS